MFHEYKRHFAQFILTYIKIRQIWYLYFGNIAIKVILIKIIRQLVIITQSELFMNIISTPESLPVIFNVEKTTKYYLNLCTMASSAAFAKIMSRD